MIIFTPVDLPKIEPDNWDIFWQIWNKHADWLYKSRISHIDSVAPIGLNNVWVGLDIYKKPIGNTSWKSPYVDIENIFPKMYQTLLSIDPLIYRIRLVQSKKNIVSHTDDNLNRWSIRSLFYFPYNKSQWYFTKPNDIYGDRTYITMPEDTNWFMYNDKYAWHGTDYIPNEEKILLQCYSFNILNNSKLLKNSILKYNKYVIKFD